MLLNVEEAPPHLKGGFLGDTFTFGGSSWVSFRRSSKKGVFLFSHGRYIATVQPSMELAMVTGNVEAISRNLTLLESHVHRREEDLSGSMQLVGGYTQLHSFLA